jgi:hypothetical protein
LQYSQFSPRTFVPLILSVSTQICSSWSQLVQRKTMPFSQKKKQMTTMPFVLVQLATVGSFGAIRPTLSFD